MENKFNYVVLGAGRQGTSAAYDLAKIGYANSIILADRDMIAAKNAAHRINSLLQTNIIHSQTIDVTNENDLVKLLIGADVTLSAVPYYYNLGITKAAIKAKTSLCDMGGHTGIVRQQLALDKQAKEAGISIVPDCGMGPGLIVTMAAFVINLFDTPQEIYIYDGGLPQNPIPPWNYQSTFHINGLTNEMDGDAYFIRNGKVTPVATLTEPEFIDFPPLGKLEADITSGGLSTSPWTFESKLEIYQNKTLRYPGHFEWWRAYKALGLFSENPLKIKGTEIVPRDIFHALLTPHISAEDIHDVCAIRIRGVGEINYKTEVIHLDLLDYYDPVTKFTAMERLTGWHCSIMMIFQALGKVQPGGTKMEIAVPPEEFMDEVKKRGINFRINSIN
ncbi:MAG: saccharopine dehydrogenase NADP-binding domain-containing protein [Anaerolineales bacterium]|nr:saccharopine dehydrogenase NADP-binding domain-containing protein [Anaerolineales bacterium]